MKYRQEAVWRPVTGVTEYHVIASNGRTVARCTSEAMAEKIIKGLALYAVEKKKMDDFRI